MADTKSGVPFGHRFFYGSLSTGWWGNNPLRERGRCGGLQIRHNRKKGLYNANPSIYLDVGLTQVNVTPSSGVGSSVPFCNAVCTAAVQVIVQCLEIVESP